MVPESRKNATLIARVAPSDGTLPGSASAGVKVSPRIWSSGGASLGRPRAAGRRRRLGASSSAAAAALWKDYKTVKIVDGEGFTSLPKGTHTLRARFSGSNLCTAGTSRAFTIRVP